MRAAVIDIGSNSTKLVIGEKAGDDIKILESLKNVVAIGQNTFYRARISQEIFNEITHVLEKYKTLIKQYEVTETKVIATTAVREAENRDIFLDTVERKTGFKIEVLNVGDVVYFIDAFRRDIFAVKIASSTTDVTATDSVRATPLPKPGSERTRRQRLPAIIADVGDITVVEAADDSETEAALCLPAANAFSVNSGLRRPTAI